MPLDETLEIWRLSLTNLSSRPRTLSLFSALEFALWDAWDDATNYQRNFNIGEVEVEDGVIYHKTEYRERRDHFAYFACSHPLAGFDTQREAFLGPYRGWDNPQVVEAGRATNSIAHGWAPIGSHHVRLQLEAGATEEVIFILGYQENPREEKFDPPESSCVNKRRVWARLAYYLQPGHVDAALVELAAYWDGLLRRFTGDAGPGHEPDGQHLECLPVHGHVQLRRVRPPSRIRRAAVWASG